jgi:hypothetical protein
VSPARDDELRAAREVAATWMARAVTAEAAAAAAAEELARRDDEVAELRAELEVLRRTKLLRWTAAPRRIYATLRTSARRPD